jgi:cobalt-zinc-cadmium efflux system outer membrane protein
MNSIRRSFWTIGLMALCGCSFMVSQVDREISKMAAGVQPMDIHPAYDQAASATPQAQSPSSGGPAAPEKVPVAPAEELPAPRPNVELPAERDPTPQAAPDKRGRQNNLLLAAAVQQLETKPPSRVVVPPNLPGAKAPLLRYPKDPEEQKRMLQETYPPLPPVPQMRPPAPGPEGRPMNLTDLQRLAAVYSPAIKSAEAAVEAAKGAVKQAGAYPNPTAFFEQDTVGTGSMGYEGFGSHLTVVTAGKLKLQQAAAMMDLLNAQVALKRAYIDVAYQVRTNYFALLVAREGVRINQALYEFSLDIFQFQVEQVQGLRSAPYEPMQLRPLILQARFNLIQSQNQYLASWRQLAAALGLRDMPLTEVEGRVDMPIPIFEYNAVLAFVLANHTDVRTANNTIQQAKFNLQLARVTPVPNVDLNLLGQKDGTAPPNAIAHSLQASIPIPIFNQNLGGIKQATGQLIQSQADLERTRNNLTQSLADAFQRYLTNRENVAITQQQVQDQVRVYRHVRERYFGAGAAGGLDFTDMFVVQQSLVTYITNYVAALGMQWLAVCDVANLLQTDDLFQVGPKKEMVPVPDLPQLAPRPGMQPCSATSSESAPQGGKAVRSAPQPSGILKMGSLPTLSATPDQSPRQPVGSTPQPAPVAQPADTADDPRSRVTNTPQRGQQ